MKELGKEREVGSREAERREREIDMEKLDTRSAAGEKIPRGKKKCGDIIWDATFASLGYHLHEFFKSDGIALDASVFEHLRHLLVPKKGTQRQKQRQRRRWGQRRR